MDSYLDTKKIKVPNSANMLEQMPNRGFLHYSSLHFFHFFWWTNSVDPPGVTTSAKSAETQTPIQARGKRCWRQGKPVGAPSGYGSQSWSSHWKYHLSSSKVDTKQTKQTKQTKNGQKPFLPGFNKLLTNTHSPIQNLRCFLYWRLHRAHRGLLVGVDHGFSYWI